MTRTLAYIGATEDECRAAMARTTEVRDGDVIRKVIRLIGEPRIDTARGRVRIQQEAVLR